MRSSRGGGQHGHLGLVLSPVAYQLVSLTPFDRPVDPGEFIIAPNANYAVDQMQLLERQHNGYSEAFEKVEAINAALKQFLAEAIKEEFLLEVRNSSTLQLEVTIHEIITALFNNYGNVTEKQFIEKQQLLNSFTYDPSTPIDRLFKMAEDYQEYANAANSRVAYCTRILHLGFTRKKLQKYYPSSMAQP